MVKWKQITALPIISALKGKELFKKIILHHGVLHYTYLHFICSSVFLAKMCLCKLKPCKHI